MLTELTVYEAGEKLKNREFKPAELLAAYRNRIEAVEAKIKAYTTVVAAENNSTGTASAGIVPGNSPLAGIPMALKDNICTRGIPTTCCSRILADYCPPYNATAVETLYEDGAVLLGKTNMDEFAMGSSTEHSAFHTTRNPWDLDRAPGGSSGGSAAAVAAREAAFALGSDTGGSIRQPAAYCGVVGMKPTYGLVSRYGLVAFASSLDQIGPLTKDVRDCALVLNSICRYDKRDSTSVRVKATDYTAALGRDVKGMKIGVPKELMTEGIAPEVRQLVTAALSFMEKNLGVEVEEASLPHSEYALPAYYIIAPAEASSNLARYDGVRYGLRVPGEDLWDTIVATRSKGFGREVKRRIMLGTYVLSSGYYDAYYLKALKVRTKVKEDFAQAFQRFDLLVTPTTPTPAFKIGEKTRDYLTMYLNDMCTVPVNLAGLPAISLPCGLTGGLPVGLQIIGPAFGEEAILSLGYAYEQGTGQACLKPRAVGGGI
ncbi:MAG TPA: Asp-tRNA(Asn)/Glu-tRNA(Gln) amidotransferase subunit GatA [Firmicutes bacterium]|nr:Asp-tRNA(Asn)/Glu-tRNA(Gln) amidotransferase subunit GatA [Bacillota bacterium]